MQYMYRLSTCAGVWDGRKVYTSKSFLETTWYLHVLDQGSVHCALSVWVKRKASHWSISPSLSQKQNGIYLTKGVSTLRLACGLKGRCLTTLAKPNFIKFHEVVKFRKIPWNSSWWNFIKFHEIFHELSWNFMQFHEIFHEISWFHGIIFARVVYIFYSFSESTWYLLDQGSVHSALSVWIKRKVSHSGLCLSYLRSLIDGPCL
jgi:hypothetical protein